MEQFKIQSDRDSFYQIFYAGDVELVNPVDYYRKQLIEMSISLDREKLLAENPPFPREIFEQALLIHFSQQWEKFYEELLKIEISNNFLALFHAKSKNEQEKLLRDQSLTPEQFFSLIFKVSTNYGYLFSQYISEHSQKGVDKTDLPKVASIENNELHTVGDTSLSEGKIRQAIQHRRVTIANFFDKDDEWHCFFTTYKNLRGEEKPWKNGQPHYHYISDKFGMTRERVLNELRDKNYNLSSLPHIDFLNYGN